VSAPHVVLVGMMGSGKTSVGLAVAARLGRPFVDVDHVIVDEQGRSIGDIFGLDGEAAFRGYESGVLAEVLANEQPTVVCTGGGAVLAPANRALMHERGTVVWLDAPPSVLARRLANAVDGRPLLRFDGDDDLEGPALLDRLQRLSDERRDAYAEAADHTIAVGELTVDQAAAAVADLVTVAEDA
jgi:shikimate kinase